MHTYTHARTHTHTQVLTFILFCLLGVNVRVVNSVVQVNENISPFIISLTLNQPSCVPITIVATPQERSPPSATGMVTDQ